MGPEGALARPAYCNVIDDALYACIRVVFMYIISSHTALSNVALSVRLRWCSQVSLFPLASGRRDHLPIWDQPPALKVASRILRITRSRAERGPQT